MSEQCNEVGGDEKRTRVLFFVVDRSNSMSGDRINYVNDAIKGAISGIDAISRTKWPNVQFKVAILAPSERTKWLTQVPMDIAHYLREGLEIRIQKDSGCGIRYSDIFRELKEKLSNSAFMGDPAQNFHSGIVLMVDSEPDDDYVNALQELKKEEHFESAFKAAIAIGEDPQMDVLEEFVGNGNFVVNATDRKVLCKQIHTMSFKAAHGMDTDDELPLEFMNAARTCCSDANTEKAICVNYGTLSKKCYMKKDENRE
jgi:uncharacterized protein YegL